MLQEKITEDIKTAMKEGDKETVSILRMVQAALKNRRIDLMKDLTEEDEIAVVRSMVKQYSDSISDFKKGEREDLAEKTEAEVAKLKSYLPAELSEDEIKKVIAAKKEELGVDGPGDFGKLMGAVMKELGPRATGDTVSKLVREILS